MTTLSLISPPPPPAPPVTILDSTLRDGAQAENISFSLADKIAIARALDAFGVSYIEGGNPGANPKDAAFFQALRRHPLTHAKLAAFGSTRRKNIHAEADENLQALIAAHTPTVVIFGKAAAWQVREILHTSLPENLAMIRESIEFLRRQQKEVIFDAEHFFDGYAENPAYALAVLTAAQTGGAAIITLCDTNGGTLPTPISHITRTVVEKFSTLSIGIHAHNDAGCAIANSLVAIEAGATHAHGTFNGIGERCGNADLVAIIAGVTLKKRRRCDGDLRRLHATATTLAEIANAKISPHAPYIGSGAFAHKAGMHAAAVRKNPASFEHVDPAAIGNRRRFVISELAGRELVIEKIKDLAPELNRRSAAVKTILAKLKEREFAGYQYEAADASFALLVKSVLGQRQKFFSLLRYKTSGEFPAPENETPATAMVKIEVEGKMEMTAASGYGPVHALDLALRKALTVFYPQIGRVRLTDYKVRVLDENAATAAVTRVLIESSDGAKVWNTVGVSADIIEASMLALLDAINYKLEMG